MAKVLTEDEARRIASNIAKLPSLLGKGIDASASALAPYGRLPLVGEPLKILL